MKETVLSTCEKKFILKAISEGRRLDGRKADECRKLQINFGTEWGSCTVRLGETRVLAQVSCEVQQPKSTRPNEGLLLIYVELSPMGAPYFEQGRQSDLAVQLNRLLEKCLKDSRCVDLESLCITAEEKVWAVRVDINILNHAGNLLDAASVAALAALSHFRRPDVTSTGEETIIHDYSERDPIPISLHHYPVCVSYVIFNKGENVVADPTVIEERVSEAQLIFGMNGYRELCGLHLAGSALATRELVQMCANQAAKRAIDVIDSIKSALEKDQEARTKGLPIGFSECIRSGSLLSLSHEKITVQLDSIGLRESAKKLVEQRMNRIKQKFAKKDEEFQEENEDSAMEDEDISDEKEIVSLDQGAAELRDANENKNDVKETNISKWENVSSEDESSSSMSDSEVEVIKEVTSEEKRMIVDSIVLSGDSEEEETSTLHPEEVIHGPKENDNRNSKSEDDTRKTARSWYPKSTW